MANIRKITGKNGVAYKITVTKGRNQNGKQMRHYMTWTPDRPMTERQMQKAVERAAMDFERSIEQGYQIDNRQTFAQYKVVHHGNMFLKCNQLYRSAAAGR